MQCRQFAGDLIMIGVRRDVTKVGRCCDWELRSIVEPFIEECPYSVQLVNGHKGVPIGNRSPTAITGGYFGIRSAGTFGSYRVFRPRLNPLDACSLFCGPNRFWAS